MKPKAGTQSPRADKEVVFLRKFRNVLRIRVSDYCDS
jgi:hypothetical protein